MISSINNPIINELLILQSSKGRKEKKRYLAEGIRTVSTIAQHQEPIKIFITESARKDAQVFDESLLTLVSPKVMKTISQAKTPSGIIGLFLIPEQPSFDELNAGIVLYNLSDPGNVGTLMRTTAAMDKKTVVCIGGVDPYNFKVVQSTAGVIAQLALFQCDWPTLVKHKKNLDLTALVVSDGEHPDKINFSDTLLVIGSEAHGLPTSIIQQCNTRLTLPMPGKTESLNAAVAGSIAIYLAWQR